MKDAAKKLSVKLEKLLKSLKDKDEIYLLELFVEMLQDDTFLEEENYFREHGEPIPREDLELWKLLTFPEIDPELTNCPEEYIAAGREMLTKAHPTA